MPNDGAFVRYHTCQPSWFEMEGWQVNSSTIAEEPSRLAIRRKGAKMLPSEPAREILKGTDWPSRISSINADCQLKSAPTNLSTPKVIVPEGIIDLLYWRRLTDLRFFKIKASVQSPRQAQPPRNGTDVTLCFVIGGPVTSDAGVVRRPEVLWFRSYQDTEWGQSFYENESPDSQGKREGSGHFV